MAAAGREICALCDTLIADADGIYDPGSYNDRLLLGLKGTMSEAELHILKARMMASAESAYAELERLDRILEVFAALPEADGTFVNVGVDLYEPTRLAWRIFPRLSPSGVIVDDDFKAPLFPGSGCAWHEFFESRDLSHIVLDTGQTVFMNS